MLGLLVSGSVALWIAILSTPFLIRYFRQRELGQHIREDGPASHSAKAGTPDHGWHRHRRRHGLRVRHRPHRHRDPLLAHRLPRRGRRRGLRSHRLPRRLHQGPPQAEPRTEQAGQVGRPARVRARLRRAGRPLGPHLDRAVVHPGRRHRHQSGPVSVGPLRRPRHGRLVQRGEHHRRRRRPGRRRRAPSASPCCRSWATGSSGTTSIYHVLPASAIDLSLVAVALAGACIGFLWWNAAPAKIIMGDTGSLAIGAGLAALCLLLNLDLCCWSSAGSSSWRPSR